MKMLLDVDMCLFGSTLPFVASQIYGEMLLSVDVLVQYPLLFFLNGWWWAGVKVPLKNLPLVLESCYGVTISLP